LCKSENISRAEAVRRTLSEVLDRKKPAAREQAFWNLAETWRQSQVCGKPAQGMGLMKAVLDSDILIDYLQGMDQAKVEISRYSRPLYSIIS